MRSDITQQWVAVMWCVFCDALSVPRPYNESVSAAKRLDKIGDRIGEMSCHRSEFREYAVQGDWIRNDKKAS
jgi:hypothetical protein